ncbi:Acid phosphatase pho1 [Trifolium repens]|nr:Acid phosphatase pho1 [Trifolium repens]
MGSLEGNEGYGRADYFLVDKDFPSYLECQEEVDKASRDKKVQTPLLLSTTVHGVFAVQRSDSPIQVRSVRLLISKHAILKPY